MWEYSAYNYFRQTKYNGDFGKKGPKVESAKSPAYTPLKILPDGHQKGSTHKLQSG